MVYSHLKKKVRESANELWLLDERADWNWTGRRRREATCDIFMPIHRENWVCLRCIFIQIVSESDADIDIKIKKEVEPLK